MIAATADTPGVNGATVKTASAHAAAVKAAASAAPATSCEGIFWNKARGHQGERRRSGEYRSKHRAPPYFGIPRARKPPPALLRAVALHHLTRIDPLAQR